MNQNFYNSNSSGFDQSQPSQFLVIHQPPQEMSIHEIEDLKQQYLDEMKRLINSEYCDEIKIDELKGNFNSMSIGINKKEKLQQLEQVANLSTYPSKRFNSFCYDDDDEDYTTVITPYFPITDSLIMENEHLDTIPEMESDEFIKSSDENRVPILNLNSTPKNDRFDTKSYLLESLLNRDTLMASSPKFYSLLEVFSGELAHIDLIPSGINEAFYDNHVKEISSGSTTTYFDSSLYDSFIFDLWTNPFPLVDRSDFYEFADELTHIISPPKYDCVCFKIEPNPGDFMMDVVEDTFPTRKPRVHNALPTHPIFQMNLDFILSRNEDTTFDPGICSYHISSFLADVSHQSGTFTEFKVLNESPMEILISTCSPMDQ
uniref:Reverse transcriptase domain-containing protein n=1 Tax=Tanacetum cinerariifolium TaxID=118510 RepID=A0A6L2NSP6_TANCI|nr:hypothetical protein [Tanacetum cinerariifolium]